MHIWQLRSLGFPALYVTATGQRVVVLRVFVKRTPKTPNREIALAMQRAKELHQ